MAMLRTPRGKILVLLAVFSFGFSLLFFSTPASALPSLRCTTVGNSPSGSSGREDTSLDPSTDITTGCDSTPATIKYYLKQAGYDNNAIAGILGNFSAESCGYRHKAYCSCSSSDAEDGFKAYELKGGTYTLNPRLKTTSKSGKSSYCGFGLVQWTHDSNPKYDRLLRLQKYADAHGKPVTDLEIQIAFIVLELTSDGSNSYGVNKYYSNVLRPEKLNGRSVEDVTWRVEKWYESPSSVYGSPGYGEYRKVCSDANSSWCKSYTKRLGRAKEALSVVDCTPSSNGSANGGNTGSGDTNSGNAGGDNSGSNSQPQNGGNSGGGGSSSPDPVDPIDSTDVTPTVTTSGAVGAKNANNVISQTDAGVKSVQWMPNSSSSQKKIGVNDDGKCCGSGCSLVAVANAYGYIHGYSKSQIESFAKELAAWTKSNINGPSPANTNKMIAHVGMSKKEVWSSYNTSESKKIAEIRSALASGGAIIAAGKRTAENERKDGFCNSTTKADGRCVFTNGGHYIAIIGITNDDKLVVANPGNSNGRNWIFPASNVLKNSNLGIMVK